MAVSLMKAKNVAQMVERMPFMSQIPHTTEKQKEKYHTFQESMKPVLIAGMK